MRPKYADRVYEENRDHLNPMENTFTDLNLKPLNIEESPTTTTRITGRSTKIMRQETTQKIIKIQKVRSQTGSVVLALIISVTLATLITMVILNLYKHYQQYVQRKRRIRKQKLARGINYTPPKGPQNLIKLEIKKEIEDDTQERIDRKLRGTVAREGTPIELTNLPRMLTRLRTLQHLEFQIPMWAIKDEAITPWFGHRPNTIGTFV